MQEAVNNILNANDDKYHGCIEEEIVKIMLQTEATIQKFNPTFNELLKCVCNWIDSQ